jgi:hypothetical protein
MAEETMVKDMLTKEMIQAGADLVRRLDEAHLGVNAASCGSIYWRRICGVCHSSPAVKDVALKGSIRKFKQLCLRRLMMPTK